MARQLACLRHIVWTVALVPLALVPNAGASGHDLDLMAHDMMAQEAHLAEFGWEETVIEDGAIIIRQGQEDYLPFLVATEAAYPFVYNEDYYYMPPPIVVRRAGLRVTVNGGGKPFSYWPPVLINADDPGPPPALGPGIPDENSQMPEDVQAYWLQKEIHLLRNYDYETACAMYYDCLEESSELSGGEWTVLGHSPRERFYNAFELHSKRWGEIPGPALYPYQGPPVVGEFYINAKEEYRRALASSSSTQNVLFITPNRWSSRFHLTQPDAENDMAVMISDLPKEEKLARLSQPIDPSQFPIVHSSPALEARLDRARQERATLH